MGILWNRTVSVEFRANRQNFHTMKLGEIVILCCVCYHYDYSYNGEVFCGVAT